MPEVPTFQTFQDAIEAGFAKVEKIYFEEYRIKKETTRFIALRKFKLSGFLWVNKPGEDVLFPHTKVLN